MASIISIETYKSDLSNTITLADIIWYRFVLIEISTFYRNDHELLQMGDLWDKVSLGAFFSSGWDLVVCAALISLHFDCYSARITAHTYTLISLL